MDELTEIRGTQTHRAYWVADREVVGFAREGRQGKVTLSNGDAVPVSRNRLSVVRDKFAVLGEAV